MSEDFGSFQDHVHRYFDKFEVPFRTALTEHELHVMMPHDGVVLIHAPWSGYSIINMHRILSVIRDRGRPFPEVVIVSIDTLTPQTMLSLIGGVAHGYAEGARIRDGQVIAAHAQRAQFEAFLEALRG